MAPSGAPWVPIIFIIINIIMINHLVVPSSAASETELLLKFKESLQDNNKLSSWNESSSPCGEKSHWVGVLCYNGKIWGLKLENMGLKGTVDVYSLKELSNLRTLSFMNNDFEGSWPEFHALIGLKTLYISNNKFSGEIPGETFQGMQWLKKLHLSNNQFTSSIPTSLILLPRLMELRMENNKFTGNIPKLSQKTLKSFNVANNRLHGQIPATLSHMPPSSFAGNEGLCGAPLEACPSNKPSTISIVVVAVVVGVAVIVIVLVIFMLNRRKQQSSASLENPASTPQRKSHAKDLDDASVRSASSASTHSRRGDTMKLTFIKDDREKFDLTELLRASAEILGSGCYSSSYKASMGNGPMMVVKRFKAMNNVGREEFQEHMRRIGRLKHPNLLPLVAYYYRREEKLLVTDFVQNGSLAVRLHAYQGLGQPSLDWPTRLKIVKGIAKGLEFLYREMPSLIAPHGNLKSSNVLLTESFEPLLNDYGLAPVVNQELAHDIMSIYKSPEYVQNGRVTKKTDVWTLGVLILETLTGKFPANFLHQGKSKEEDLPKWVLSISPEEWPNKVFDKEMGSTRNSDGEMVKLLKIGLGCCEADMDKRWDLKEAVEKIQEVKERENDDDFYSTYSEADMKSRRGLSDEINF
ncbi:hypothetical protein L6164_006961 [Bauhinia variegata]|uniref:Uncharacterized protein n=1 Tax=Bauhinia variegata TaxID=167791 RepID=A0ACB9PWL1_BAUVA|nr:hypothetical protein L6164_006961 [Bauhinia variegata]